MPRAPPYQTPSIAKHCLNLAHDSGKSAAGQKLSTALSYCFFDTDDMIVALSGKSIADIFREEGEEAFRTTETAVIQGADEQGDALQAAVAKLDGLMKARQALYEQADIVIPLDSPCSSSGASLEEQSLHHVTESLPVTLDPGMLPKPAVRTEGQIAQ
ncbi:hypothetical protein APUTEX25_005464 [Auxenochlorella protothecoides]|uniref:Uncharacterized protein n=1 Tax=Auxenochlorella protothecoides TaxID=3075 RepID=A0A3M7L168_AUXPR|nr:hypothetical protein APUTEX25_005464 [Auxenochlorella protothecoides]|eukprot:RMZ55186.1 hypothetical protein APUTEX25_005464 [Auxenochlorella protothecoides]